MDSDNGFTFKLSVIDLRKWLLESINSQKDIHCIGMEWSHILEYKMDNGLKMVKTSHIILMRNSNATIYPSAIRLLKKDKPFKLPICHPTPTVNLPDSSNQ